MPEIIDQATLLGYSGGMALYIPDFEAFGDLFPAVINNKWDIVNAFESLSHEN